MKEKTFHEIELEAWSERASYYDDIFASIPTQAIDHILDSLGTLEGKHHLDVACGTGHLVAVAAKRGAISEGLDFAPTMVASAQANYPRERFQVGDAVELPYEDESFDIVTCSFGLSNMEKPQAAIDEAFRILKVGGHFAFTLWYSAEGGNEQQAIVKRALAKHATKDITLPAEWSQLRTADQQACRVMTQQTGFGSPDFKRLPIVFHASSAQEVADIFNKLSVRTKMVIEGQPAVVQEQIYQQILFEAEAHRTNGFIPLDWPALLTVVQKPAKAKSIRTSTQLEPKYTLFDSLEEILASETLSKLLSQPITRVDCQPITEHGGVAGGYLSYVNTDAGRLVLKQMSLKHDWLMYASDDQQCRSVTLWQFGLLDQLQPDVAHKTIACAHDGTGWGILMHDLSEGLFHEWDKPIPPKLVPVYLDRMARIHATFWNDPRLDDPRLGLCDSATRLNITSPKLAHNQHSDQRGPLPEWIRDGWDIMETALDRDVFLSLRQLRDDPHPLLDAMNRYPLTLVHGDYRDANLAFLKPGQPVIFDWQQAAHSLMTVDFAWFAGNSYVQDVMGKTQTIRYYRKCLESYLGRRFADMDWEAMMALGYLYNNLFITCVPAYFSVHDDSPEVRASFEMNLAERNQQVRDGIRWL